MGGWVKNEGAKRSKILDVVSYTSEMSVNWVTCVFVGYFRFKKNASEVCKLA